MESFEERSLLVSLKAVDQPRFGERLVHVRSLLVEVQIFVGDFAGGVGVP